MPKACVLHARHYDSMCTWVVGVYVRIAQDWWPGHTEGMRYMLQMVNRVVDSTGIASEWWCLSLGSG